MATFVGFGQCFLFVLLLFLWQIKINEALIYCATYLALNWRTLSANVSVILLDRIRTIPCDCMCERVFVSVPKYIEYIRLIMMVVVDRWMDGCVCTSCKYLQTTYLAPETCPSMLSVLKIPHQGVFLYCPKVVIILVSR